MRNLQAPNAGLDGEVCEQNIGIHWRQRLSYVANVWRAIYRMLPIIYG